MNNSISTWVKYSKMLFVILTTNYYAYLQGGATIHKCYVYHQP